jgi:Flp pilus assembly protein TadD
VDEAADIDPLYEQARTAFRSDRFDEASSILLKLTEKYPAEPIFYSDLAHCRRMTNQMDAAIQFDCLAITLDPGWALSWWGLGLAFWEKGDLVRAESVLRHSVSLGRSAVRLFTLARLLGSMRKEEEAIALTREVVSMDPTNEEAYFLLGLWSTYLDRLADAETYFTQAIALEPNYARAQSELGFLQYGLAKTDLAVRTLSKAVALEPESHESHFYLALALRALGEADEAARELMTAVDLCPDVQKRAYYRQKFETSPCPVAEAPQAEGDQELGTDSAPTNSEGGQDRNP